jgi:ArsR family transcriptional regulator
MIYAARYDTMNELLGYLTENCCQGCAGQCAPAARMKRTPAPARRKEPVT